MLYLPKNLPHYSKLTLQQEKCPQWSDFKSCAVCLSSALTFWMSKQKLGLKTIDTVAACFRRTVFSIQRFS